MLNNPPIPIGYTLMHQLAVTPAMTAWALEILRDPKSYPLFATAKREFDQLNVLARVEWHPPDFQNRGVHRGVTLYENVGVDSGAPAEGIDVSGYQPIVNWVSVAASGIAFAFIKATEGATLLDHAFASHWAQAKQAMVLRGAYHFFRPRLDALAQAKFFLAQLSDPGELPPVLDVEAADGVAPAQIAAGVGTWLNFVSASVGRVIVYTSPAFWNALPPIPDIASTADLWVATWGARAPATTHGWPKWTFWQHTNKATVAGIPGTADMDENRFSGSLPELRAYSAAFTASRPAPASTCPIAQSAS